MNTSHCTPQDTSIGFTLGATLAQGVAQGAGSLGGFVQRLISLPVAAIEVFMTWQERASERRHLGQLDDRLLADMGLSRADVERETSIPFWRAT